MMNELDVRCQTRELKQQGFGVVQAMSECIKAVKGDRKALISSIAAAKWIEKNRNEFCRIWNEV
ncbi:MAG: hypothetical protein ABF624_01600 [Liquorilactobacillus ghanensis]|uniref:hypothetical protein n=1 Tax=Liquorilactobacillus ghanensis TaxID=399370 RepID=UPI0039ED4499